MINFSITTLVKATYEKLNKYFVDHGTQADAMISSKQVYTLIVAKFINEEETKQRRRMGKCNVRLDQRTCYYGKSQKLHMSCAHVIAASKHININYMQYVHPVYTLDYVSNECIKSH
ncbi:hypothetical protein GmHk_U059459 [Glycine max]|nr:hypothetical protein GmHk_U059459 [Glycine max]